METVKPNAESPGVALDGSFPKFCLNQDLQD